MSKHKVGSFDHLKRLVFRFDGYSLDYRIKETEYDLWLMSELTNSCIGHIIPEDIDNSGFFFRFMHFGIHCKQRVEFDQLVYFTNDAP